MAFQNALHQWVASVQCCLLLSLAFLLSCTGESGFEVEFVWEQPPEQSLLVVTAQLRAKNNPAEAISGTVLEEYRPGGVLNLRFRIPLHGQTDDLVMYVEFRASRGRGGQILYYGISDPFKVTKGESTSVLVRVPISPTPNTRSSAPHRPWINIEGVVEDPLTRRRYLRNSDIVLRLTTDTGKTVEVSNSPLIVGETPPTETRIVLTNGERGSGGAWTYRVPWNLDAGLFDLETGEPGNCRATNSCTRRVFVRFYDKESYSSPIDDLEVVVDTQTPSVVPGASNLDLVPSPENILTQQRLQSRLTRATAGTRIRVSFSINEPVVDTPPVEVRAVNESSGTSFPLERNDGSSGFLYEGEILSRYPDGTYSVQVTATDVAGNMGTSTATTFEIDQKPPPAPVLPDRKLRPLTYIRAPYGPDPAGVFRPYFALVGASGAVESGATILVFGGPDPNVDLRLGDAIADSSGGFDPTELIPSDLARVYVLVVDPAGNPSAQQAHLVRDVTWRASFAGRVADSSAGNPHVFETRRWLLDVLRQQDGRQQSSGALRGIHTKDEEPFGEGWVTTVGGGTWRRGDALTAPQARFSAGASRDVTTGKIVIYGGRTDAFGNCDETGNEICGALWSFDGGAFNVEVPSNRPGVIAARERHAQAYDSRRGELIVFGGKGAVGCTEPNVAFCGDTWAFAETWRDLTPGKGITPDGLSPQRRVGHAMVYDSFRSEIIMFGGTSEEGNPCEGPEIACRATWRWTGKAWEVAQAANSSSPAPLSRREHAMAYDPVRRRVVLFGGNRPIDNNQFNVERLDDTWEWDGAGWSQVGLAAVVPQPTARDDASMTFSPKHGRVVMFGGFAGQGESCDDGEALCDVIWGWTGDQWERIEPTVNDLPRPVGRTAAAIDVDATGRLIIIGGRRLVSDRFQTGDPTGDCLAGEAAACTGVWAFEDGFWSELAGALPGTSTTPSERAQHTLTSIPGAGHALLYGGAELAGGGCSEDEFVQCGDTWLWNGSYWTRDSTPSAPSPRQGHEAYWDPNAGRVVTVGGFSQNFRTAFCDGAGWKHCEAFWTYILGSGWVEIADGFDIGNPLMPDPRRLHGLAYDAAENRVVVLSGSDGGVIEDAWSYAFSTATWTRTDPAPVGRFEPAMAWNSETERAVAFGGYVSEDSEAQCPSGSVFREGRCAFGDTWVFDGTSWTLAWPTVPEATDRPTARRDATMVYVEDRNELTLFGGDSPRACSEGSLRCNDVWTYRKGKWRKMPAADLFGQGPPAVRWSHAATYDPDRRQMLVFGGRPFLKDTWIWYPPLHARPGHVARFRFGAAFAAADPQQARDERESAELLGAHLLWEGSAEADEETTDAELLLWHRGMWRRAADASESGLSDGRWTSTNSTLLGEMVTGTAGELGFALVPRIVMDDRQLKISSDVVELTVDYRLPSED